MICKEMISDLTKKYITDGKKYIYPQKHEAWEKLVEKDVKSSWSRECLTYFFKTIKAIQQKNSIEQIKSMLCDRYNCDNRNEEVVFMILNYYKGGPRFYFAYWGDKLTERQIARAKTIEAQNKVFRKEIAKSKLEQKSVC